MTNTCIRILEYTYKYSAILVHVLVLGALGACGDSTPSGAGATTAAPPPPLPPPPDLALECVLPTPDATWEKARAQIGGGASFLPRSAGGLVAVMLHFPIAVSEAIDGRVPAVCAGTLSGDGSTARAVLGVHLRWPDRLLDGLTKGQDARFESRIDPATQVAVLEARDPKDAVMPAGVLGNYLLVAARAEDLTALGPYVARTMPARAKGFPTAGVRIAGAPEPPPVDFIARVPAAAVGGAVASAGARIWSTARERAASLLSSPLPFAGAADDALALLPHLDGAELRVAIGDRGPRIEATAAVRRGSEGEAKVRAMPAGDAAPLLAMPKDTLAGVLVRRAPSASAGAPALDLAKVLGVSDPKDAATLEAAGRALEASAGDWLAAGFAFDGTGPSGFVRAAVRDGEALDGALKELVAIAERAAPVDPVQGKELRIKTGKTVLENIPGDVYRLRLARGASQSGGGAASPAETPSAIDVLFRRRDDVFVAATGYASRDALRALLAAPSGESVAQVPEVAEPLSRLGAGVLLAAFLDPGRITASRAGKPGSVPAAPVVVGLGRTGSDTVVLQLTVEAGGTAAAELSRWLAP